MNNQLSIIRKLKENGFIECLLINYIYDSINRSIEIVIDDIYEERPALGRFFRKIIFYNVSEYKRYESKNSLFYKKYSTEYQCNQKGAFVLQYSVIKSIGNKKNCMLLDFGSSFGTLNFVYKTLSSVKK